MTSIANQSYELAGPVGTASLISSITNGPYGPISYALGNGLDAVRSYDSLGRNNGGWICSGSMSDYCAGGAQLYGYFVTLRGAQIASICDTEINQCQNHRYDSMNRLVAVNGTQSSFTFTYDRWGNRLSQSTNSGIGSSPNGAVNPATNQVASLPYDAAGNQESDGIAHTFQYDADGNLVAVDGGNTASYVYDALNRRVQATTSSGSVEYSYDAMGRRISAWQASSNFGIEARMYWGMSQIAFRNGPTYFDHQNYLGTERLRTDSVGAVATTEYSLAYGDSFTQTTSVAGSDGDNEQYAGQEHDSESGTEHAQFRQYSSSLGRWLSPDPYDGSYDLTDPQSLDRYTYVRDNPLNAKDPTGLQRQGPSGNGCDTEEYDCGTDLPGTDGQFTDLVGTITVTNDQGGEYQYDPGTYNSIMSGESDLAWSGSSAYIDAGGNWYYTGVNVYETFFNASVGPSINPFGGGAPTAPNNGTQKPGFWSCTFTGKVGMSLASTTLDAVGIIPGGGNVLHGIQFGAGLIGAGLSVFGSPVDAGLSATGVGLAFADKAGASIALHGTEMIPVVGNIVSAGATLHDVFGDEGLIANYKGCMAGTHP